MSNDGAYESFLKIGLNERTAKETIASQNVTNNLLAVINEAGVTDGCHKSIGNLLYTVATKFPADALVHRPKLLEYIVSSKIKTAARLEDALTFLTKSGSEILDIAKFEEACGVGNEVSEEEIAHIVDEIFKENESYIKKQSYGINVGFLIDHVLKKQDRADRKTVMELIYPKLNALLGEKTAADSEKLVKKKNEKHSKVEDKGTTKEAHEAVPSEEENPFLKFPKPEENLKVHTEVVFSNGNKLRARNLPEKLKEHLDATGRRVRTRFPPEPNGYLHIGHAKAMYVDFGLAEDRDGDCYLRFDDTNPEAEKTEYIEHFKEIVEWLGWKPFKITYTSDYFQKLYELAVELIKKGHAYVDHQTADEIKAYREKKMNSPWRDRPISESLKLFNDMKEGKDFEEGTPTLRMKQDMQNDNGNMYDLIAYRIKKTPHPRTGDEWCIYPSYDFSHCIVDSLENISHSLCTLEFETRRASYYWLLHVLDLYQPYVGEYSRLNITHTVMSKRKLNVLVTKNKVDGWDDPRLMTLAGLRRRGVTSTAINMFVKGTGINRSDGSVKKSESLDSYIRKELNETAPRTMVVLRPLKVVITNLDADLVVERDAKKWPNNPNNDTCYKVPFSKVVYIERTDFRPEDSKDYKGLAHGKTVLLKYAYLIKCTEVVLSEDKKTVVEIHAEYVPDEKTTIPKGIGKLHWVAEPSSGVDPLKVEVRLFNKLFNSEIPGEPKQNPEEPNQNPGEPNQNPEEPNQNSEEPEEDWLKDLNTKSKVIIPCAYAVRSLSSAKVGDTFQFERHGYFVVDKDSTPEKLVFNRTVALKDSYPDKDSTPD